MLIYFAQPIDQSLGRSRVATDIADTLLKCGLSLYTPKGAFSVTGGLLAPNPLPDLALIDRINRFALHAADALVAWLPEGVPTLGVPSEIEEAIASDKPTLVLTHASLARKSVQLANWRDRGALVMPWSEDAARSWEHRPRLLLDVLETPPSSELKLREGIDPESTQPLPVSTDLLVTLDPAAKGPGRAYQDDAGLDLAIIEECVLPVGGYKLVRTGVRAAVPSGWWGMITGRSSTWARYRCDVRMAVIDAGYRGELMIGIENRGSSSITFEAGTRLAQYVLVPTFPGQVRQVDKLPEAHRGDNGYGSSGS